MLYILNMILIFSPLMLDCPFSVPFLVHHTIFTRWVRHIFLVFPFNTDVFIHSRGVKFHLFIYPDTLGSCTIVVNIEGNNLAVTFKPSTTPIICPGDPTLRSIIILYICDIIDIKYSAVPHLYCSSQPSLLL